MTIMCTVAEAALGHRDNGRRLMAAALECFDDGLREAGEVLRELSRLEYGRALQILAAELAA
jgi:hypothetical protein